MIEDPLAAFWARQEAAQQQAELQLHVELEQIKKVIEDNPTDPKPYIQAAQRYDELHRQELAIAILSQGLSACPPSRKLYRKTVLLLEECNRPREAIETARIAAGHFPHDRMFPLKEALLLPVLYETAADIDRWREQYRHGLEQLSASLRLETPEERHAWLDAVGDHVNFYLAYQARNDYQFQNYYGALVQRVMTANYPQWTKPLPMPMLPTNCRIRVGYVSANFHYHSTTSASLGWLRESNRQDFELFAYHLGSRVDWVTGEARRACDHFRQFPDDLEGVCQAIRSDNLHVLVFIEVGLHPLMTLLAALRLAPIQCATWAHPITTGLPAIDYFLSSDLMEPPDAQDHYRERLVRLPGIGSCRQKPVIPRVLADQPRSRFGLHPDAVVYLCCQSTFKYLPQHDQVLVEIARRLPSAQFVFLMYNQFLEEDLRARIGRAFAAAGLEADNHLLFLQRLPTYVDYWNLHLVSDVFLDSLEYSGFTTTMEAIACGIPIVTLPGAFCRGRQTYAILQQLGITETIARDEAGYIDIAVRLGRDPQWRSAIVRHMADGHGSLFWDTRSVRALEEFYRRVVKEAGLP